MAISKEVDKHRAPPPLTGTARYEQANEVMELYVQNYTVAQIARMLKIKSGAVQEHVDEWRTSSKGSKFLQERIEDLLALLDEHYSRLIREMWQVVEEIDGNLSMANIKEATSLLGQKNSALKSVAEFEAKRVDVLQKAGLLEAADLGDQFAEQEEKQQQLIDILHEVTAHCDNCRIEVANRLAKVTGQPPVVVVNGEDS